MGHVGTVLHIHSIEIDAWHPSSKGIDHETAAPNVVVAVTPVPESDLCNGPFSRQSGNSRPL
jgi:hypothetical protein